MKRTPETFGCDEALDWLFDLLDEEDSFFIHDTLEILAEFPETETPEIWDCYCALAAAEMVAAARGNPPSEFPIAAVKWLKKNDLLVDEDLLNYARKAVERVSSSSELKDSWDQNEKCQEWHSIMDDLKRRLAAA